MCLPSPDVLLGCAERMKAEQQPVQLRWARAHVISSHLPKQLPNPSCAPAFQLGTCKLCARMPSVLQKSVELRWRTHIYLPYQLHSVVAVLQKSVEDAVKRVVKEAGRIDVLVNNAGVLCSVQMGVACSSCGTDWQAEGQL